MKKQQDSKAFQWDGTETCFRLIMYELGFATSDECRYTKSNGFWAEWYDGMPYIKKVPLSPMYGVLMRDDNKIEIVGPDYFEEEE